MATLDELADHITSLKIEDFDDDLVLFSSFGMLKKACLIAAENAGDFKDSLNQLSEDFTNASLLKDRLAQTPLDYNGNTLNRNAIDIIIDHIDTSFANRRPPPVGNTSFDSIFNAASLAFEQANFTGTDRPEAINTNNLNLE